MWCPTCGRDNEAGDDCASCAGWWEMHPPPIDMEERPFAPVLTAEVDISVDRFEMDIPDWINPPTAETSHDRQPVRHQPGI